MEAEQPGLRPRRACGGWDRALLLQPSSEVSKCQLKDSHPHPSLRLGCGEDRCLCLGVERGSQLWEGPQGAGAQGQVLGSSSYLGTRLAGGGGERRDKEAAHSLSEESRASGRRARASPQPDTL